MDQVTIFEVLEQFDPQLAKWENVLGCFERCTVLAYIPKDAISSLESSFKYGFSWRNEEVNRKHKIWANYTTSIWRTLGHSDKSWDIACKKLQEHRDSNKPCIMQINRNIGLSDIYYFKPDRVVEYLA